jgi:hypothetical protein
LVSFTKKSLATLSCHLRFWRLSFLWRFSHNMASFLLRKRGEPIW